MVFLKKRGEQNVSSIKPESADFKDLAMFHSPHLWLHTPTASTGKQYMHSGVHSKVSSFLGSNRLQIPLNKKKYEMTPLLMLSVPAFSIFHVHIYFCVCRLLMWCRPKMRKVITSSNIACHFMVILTLQSIFGENGCWIFW